MHLRRKIGMNRKCQGLFLVFTFLIFWMVYLQQPHKIFDLDRFMAAKYYVNTNLRPLLENLTLSSHRAEISSSSYLVNNSKCKIPNIDPLDPEILRYYSPEKYISCRNKPLLTYTSKKNNVATLHINESAKNQYTNQKIRCCYSYIRRGKTDNDINQESCVDFQNNVTLIKDTVLIRCLDEKSKEIYKNIHNVILINKKKKAKFLKHPWSVLVIGVDSVSRLNLVRSTPKTNSFLQNNGWIEFKGYNKINDNTFPNLMAILTGNDSPRVFKNCDPRIYGGLDKCKFVWSQFQKSGFVTCYAEDAASMSTFNWYEHGFKYVPTDYYFRSYMYATEKYLKVKNVDKMAYCTGPENSGERMFDIIRDFLATFETQSKFGFFWMNTFSHEKLNSVSRMDGKLVEFLTELRERKVLDQNIVLFISDHGFRFGNYSYTHTGWLEERLPAFFMSLPKWFKKEFPIQTKNLIENTEKLTSPYDLHMTLKDILILSGKTLSVKKSAACPGCKSLFQKIETERGCEDAGIPLHWCTCKGYFTIPLKTPIAIEAAKFILSEVHRTIFKLNSDIELCQNYDVDQIISAGISDANSIRRSENVYFLISFLAKPNAVFRATVSLNLSEELPTFKLEGDVSRLDVYKEKSWCVTDAILRKYCYCDRSMKITKYSYSLVKTQLYKFFSFFTS